MSDSTLISLVKILAILSRKKEHANFILEKSLVVSFLQMQYDDDIVTKYSKLYQLYYNRYKHIGPGQNGEVSKMEKEINDITESIFKSLSFRHRIFILLGVFQFDNYTNSKATELDSSPDNFNFLRLIAKKLNINNSIFNKCRSFCRSEYHKIAPVSSLLFISNKNLDYISNITSLCITQLNGMIYVLKLDQNFFIVKYKGDQTLYIDGKLLKNDAIYFFSITSSIHTLKFTLLYFNDIDKAFLNYDFSNKVVLKASNICYRYPRSKHGIHKFSFCCESNELVGVIGSSGCGKTTLMNVLIGQLPLCEGEILINGYKVNETIQFDQIIGYVPQDDILIEELTVFENLYYNAKLCKKWESEFHLTEMVNKTLDDLQIYEIRNLKVGSLLKKAISGGQRKRLNIALEIIRSPILLFIDEPTSGLSSTDSYNIIYLLKQQSLKQKIVFINIHQPSNEIFYLLDKIIILDQGGYPVYCGHPGNALKYFKEATQTIETYQDSKFQSNQEKILSIIEDTFTDEFGTKTSKRIKKPQDWYKLFIESIETNHAPTISEKIIPSDIPPVANIRVQLITTFTRNLKAKISSTHFLIMALGISPTLAIILSFICKQYVTSSSGNSTYIFSDNYNIPAFYFISVIVAMFVGLIISAEEIYKDRKIYIRERHLKLNKLCYFTSKLLLLLALSLIQTLLYALISTIILKLSGSFTIYWLSLLLIAIAGNIFGLLISGVFNNLVAIYISIPLILIPQILLSGVVVKFERLHPMFTSQKYVPFIGELMPIRWTYEALMINQFKNNNYQKELFIYDMQESNLSYNAFYLLPEMLSIIKMIELNLKKQNMHKANNYITLINQELNKLDISAFGLTPESTTPDKFTPARYEQAINQLLNITISNLHAVQIAKDSVLKNNTHKLYEPEFKNKNYNRSVAEIVLNRNNINPYILNEKNITRLFEPIYHLPENRFGRSHFFASHKLLGKTYINSTLFNNIVISLFIIIGFTLLNFNYFNKIT